MLTRKYLEKLLREKIRSERKVEITMPHRTAFFSKGDIVVGYLTDPKQFGSDSFKRTGEIIVINDEGKRLIDLHFTQIQKCAKLIPSLTKKKAAIKKEMRKQCDSPTT